jgi:phosphoribosylanthranilate isomerase
VTEVKVCGLTRPADVALACELGAAYVGFNFAAVSQRRVTADDGRRLCDAAAPGVVRVGVFVQESYERIAQVCDAARLDLVQLHRALLPDDLLRVPRPVIAVVRVGPAGLPVPPPSLLAGCRALLFDAAAPGLSGGAGVAFDWSALEGQGFPVPFFLAGGLTADNVGEAVARVRPPAVDVASGVESAPGVKDRDRMARFFEAVRRSDEAGR